MSELQHPSQITLTFSQQACRRIVRYLKLISQRMMQVEGVRSVVTQLDLHGNQRMTIYAHDAINPALLRPVDELEPPLAGALPESLAPNPEASLIAPIGIVIRSPSPTAADRPTLLVRLRQVTYGTLAAASMGLAWIGLFVPGMPTVPFVILAAVFGAKASSTFHERLKRTRVFGPMIRDWDEHQAVQPKVRDQAVAMTLVIVTITIIVSQPSPGLLLLIGSMCIFSLIVIAMIPVIKPEASADDPGPTILKILPAVA
jgi:uncharacterized membrane protein YbaN (DUF454 family)